jgi:ABC-type glycerol-3-phosphate transport system substrate-binding protein
VSRSSVDLPAAQGAVARYPLFQVALDLYLNAPASPATLMAALGPVKKVDEAVYTGVEEMLSGGKDPEQALEDAAAASNEAIDEYNQRVEE